MYNQGGQLIRSLHLGNKKAGVYVDKNRTAYWDGRGSFGQKVASSGPYFYTLQAGTFPATRKMVIVIGGKALLQKATCALSKR